MLTKAVRTNPPIRIAAPDNITGLSAIRSRSLGKERAASMEPHPKAASARAVSVWVSPSPAWTKTTVLTITMAPQQKR